MTMCHKTSSKTGYTLSVFSSYTKGFFLGHSVKCIYHAYISHVSRYSLDQKKVSSRSRLGHSRVSSRSRLGQFGKRLGLVSVSGAQVSVLVSVSTQKVLGPSLQICNINLAAYGRSVDIANFRKIFFNVLY